MMMTDIKEMIDYLDDVARLDGTEVGEYLRGLLDLRIDYGATDTLKKAVQAEIKRQYRWLKPRIAIVESVETQTRKTRTLEWIG